MNNNKQFSKMQVRLSKSGAVVVIKDELGSAVLVNANLLRHVLGVPYTKKDGTHKTVAMIRAEQARAQRAYEAKVPNRR